MQESAPSRIQIAHAGIESGSPTAELGITTTLLNRKGLLELIVRPGLDPDIAARIRADYYSAPLFDIGRCLAQILAAVYDSGTGLHALLPGAVVVLGMDVYIVGTPGMMAWITRFEGVQQAFDVAHRIGLPAQLGQRPSYAVDWELHQAHWRLTAGDALVVVAGDAIELSNSRMLKLGMRHANPADLANAVARAARTNAGDSSVLVCSASGFTPVPTLPIDPPAPQPRHMRALDDGWAPRRGFSPIWVAIVVAAIALLVTVKYAGTESSISALREYVELAFGPEPTPTPTPEPTPTPVEAEVALWPAPTLLSPGDGGRLSGETIQLEWKWERSLGSGQAFDVRVARAGQTLTSLAVTTEHTAEFAPTQTGWYEWTVVVVNNQEQGVTGPLSAAADTGAFFWRAE